MLILIVTGGLDKERVYALFEHEQVVLGREGDPIRINDRKASRRHAKLWSEGGRWYIEDLGSSHGTLRNQKPITGKTSIRDGDHIQIGRTVLVLARMPMEQAQRVAQMHQPAGGADCQSPIVTAARRRPMLITVAALAACAIVALNVWQFVASKYRGRQLRDNAPIVDSSAIESNQRDPVKTLAQDKAEPDDTRPILAQILTTAQEKPPPWNPDPILDEIQSLAEATRANDRSLVQLTERIESALNQGVWSEIQAALDPVLAELKQRPSGEQLADAIAQRLDPMLAEHLDQTDVLLRLVLTTVEAQGGTNERVDQLDQSLAERSGQTDELLRQLLARVEAQGGADQLTERLNEALVQRSDRTESLLREVLHEARAQPGAEHLLARVRRAAADGSDANAALLRRILATLKDQPALAEQIRDLRTLIEEQPAQTQVALAQIITAIPTKADYEALLSAIADVKSTFPDTADVNTGIDQVLTLLNAQATDVSVRRRGARPGRERRSVLLGPQVSETRNAGAEGDRSAPPLTRTERAYKLAFETGHPVSVGAGVINPTTGEVTEGRTLDPALARAAGIKTWRDWYLMDDFSERMRLNNQAMRFVSDHGSPVGVISLPPPPPGKTPEAGAESRPEQ